MAINPSDTKQVIEPKRPSAKMEIDSDIKLAKKLSSRDIPHDVRKAVGVLCGQESVWKQNIDKIPEHISCLVKFIQSANTEGSYCQKKIWQAVRLICTLDEKFVEWGWAKNEQLDTLQKYFVDIDALQKQIDLGSLTNLIHAFVLKDYPGSSVAENAIFINDIARSLNHIDDSLVSCADPTSDAEEIGQLGLKDLIQCGYDGHGYSAMAVNKKGDIINYNQLEVGDSFIIMDRGEPIYQGMGLENTSPVFTIREENQVQLLKKFLDGQPDYLTPFEDSMKAFKAIKLQPSNILKIEGEKPLELEGGKYFKAGICGYANKKAFVRAGLQLKHKEEGLKKYKEFATHNRIRTFEEDFLKKDIQLPETEQIKILKTIQSRLQKHKNNQRHYGEYDVSDDKYGHHPVTQYMIERLELTGPSPMDLLTAKFIQANREVLFEKQPHEAIEAVKKFVADKEQAQKEAIKSSKWNEFIESGGVFTKEIAKGKEDEILKNLIESGYSYSRLKDDGIFKITGDLIEGYLFSDAVTNRLMKKYGHITYNQPLELVVKAYLNDRKTATEVMDKIGVTLDEMKKAGFNNNAIFAEHLQGISDVSEKSSLAEIYVKLASKPEQQGKFTQQIKDHVSEVEYFIFCVSIAFHKFMEMISPSKNDSIENREETVNTEARVEENILKVEILDLTGDAEQQSRSTLHQGDNSVGHNSLTADAHSIAREEAGSSSERHQDAPSLDNGSSHEPGSRGTSI